MHPLLLTAIIALSVLIPLFLIYLFLIAPKPARKAMKKYKGARFAHRGLHHNGIAENSLSAFALACDRGFGIELDVSLSKDGVLMVFHDDTLIRMTGVEGRVCDYTASELSKIKLGTTEDTIPTFSEVLSLVSGRVPLLVEIKETDTSSRVAAAVSEALKSYTGEYLIESFNPFSLKKVRANLPCAKIGILSDRFMRSKTHRSMKFFLLQYLLLNVVARPTFVAYEKTGYRCPSLRLCKLLGAATFAWTTHGEEDTEKALSRFDAVIFETE